MNGLELRFPALTANPPRIAGGKGSRMARGLLTYRELYEAWPLISSDDQREGFLML